MTSVQPSGDFKDELSRLSEKYGPPGRRSEFTMDIMALVVSAIQAGRAAAQGASGIVMCGRCNKVVHECRDPQGREA